MRRRRSRSTLFIALIAMIGTAASAPLSTRRVATASPDSPQPPVPRAQAVVAFESAAYRTPQLFT